MRYNSIILATNNENRSSKERKLPFYVRIIDAIFKAYVPGYRHEAIKIYIERAQNTDEI